MKTEFKPESPSSPICISYWFIVDVCFVWMYFSFQTHSCFCIQLCDGEEEEEEEEEKKEASQIAKMSGATKLGCPLSSVCQE